MFDGLFLNKAQQENLSMPLFEQQYWQALISATNADEEPLVKKLVSSLKPLNTKIEATNQLAKNLINETRINNQSHSILDTILMEYPLNSDEGITLMCLAESLLRIPDKASADALIRDKLSHANWRQHINHAPSFWLNASTWALLLGSKLVQEKVSRNAAQLSVNKLITKFSEPIIREATYRAMTLLTQQFIFANNITNALQSALQSDHQPPIQRNRYSFDMLGESALSYENAKVYLAKYRQAIEQVGANRLEQQAVDSSVSIKLSALHPCYHSLNKQVILETLFSDLLQLLKLAKQLQVAITIDAEEADRLEISLLLFHKLYHHPDLIGWGQLGLAVQAYNKRAIYVLMWLACLAKQQGDRIPIRLVKGAYWDSEIKNSQQRGLNSYPVFTRKQNTDLCYLACAHFLLKKQNKALFFPQFATHNGQTISTIMQMPGHKNYELQRLFGMADNLYKVLTDRYQQRVRIYAPIGDHVLLLPYLLRRLLENGANNAFINQLADPHCSIQHLISHPLSAFVQHQGKANPNIPLPPELFLPDRINSTTINLHNEYDLNRLNAAMSGFITKQYVATAQIHPLQSNAKAHKIYAPFDKRLCIGHVQFAQKIDVEEAIKQAKYAFATNQQGELTERCLRLNKLADLIQEHHAELISLAILEAGKTVQDSLDEVKEAADFCRYYAMQATQIWPIQRQHLLNNSLSNKNKTRSPIGIVACISPWNFPLAIFVGQISAALVTGNCVIAKPAPQTCLMAYRVIELFYQAGFDKAVLQCLPGDATIGQLICQHPDLNGVIFTGSISSAQEINTNLAARDCPPAVFIAETGGLNCMIADSSAQPEQLVNDLCFSAFSSAGQRCSATRIVYLQEEICDKIIQKLFAKMATLKVGDPRDFCTDIGPVIDHASQLKLQQHFSAMSDGNHLIYHHTPTAKISHHNGYFVNPCLFKLNNIGELDAEKFGPMLHVISYQRDQIEQVIADINDSGFALTLSIQSRNQHFIDNVIKHTRVGNCYINRNQIGAQVGVQPFGGNGLSGTGPKAGGPNYLYRLTCQQEDKGDQSKAEVI